MVNAGFDSSVRLQFPTIRAGLEEDPFPRQSPRSAITEYTSPGGQTYYQFFDKLFPLILQYRVLKHPPEMADVLKNWGEGIIWLARSWLVGYVQAMPDDA